jgi:hypothetical protein
MGLPDFKLLFITLLSQVSLVIDRDSVCRKNTSTYTVYLIILANIYEYRTLQPGWTKNTEYSTHTPNDSLLPFE